VSSEVSGSADRVTPGAEHATAGEVVGSGAVVSGQTIIHRSRTAAGALLGGGSTVSGSAALTGNTAVTHTVSGSIVGGVSDLTANSNRTKHHTTTGGLLPEAAEVSGASDIITAAAEHETAGHLSGPGAGVSGQPVIHRSHITSGVIAAGGATISGAVTRTVIIVKAAMHTTAGAINTLLPLRLAIADFGTPAVFAAEPAPVTARVLFDNFPEGANLHDMDIETTGPQLHCLVADIPAAALQHGAQLTIGDQGYAVVGVARQGGEATLTLREAASE
ncbi:MAG: hypothetical protein ACNA7Q_12120, partial [Rhodobacterales bacterium]